MTFPLGFELYVFQSQKPSGNVKAFKIHCVDGTVNLGWLYVWFGLVWFGYAWYGFVWFVILVFSMENLEQCSVEQPQPGQVSKVQS